MLITASILLISLALGELAIRYLRLADYVLYEASESIGYFPLPNSTGLMRRKYRWRFDANGIRSDRVEAIGKNSVVLIGDSIVEGGAMVDQDDTVGCHLEREIRRPTYSVGGGGWSLCNELAYINENTSLLNSDVLIFILNSEDFSSLNIWKTIYTHPLAPPRSHLLYMVGRVAWAVRYKLASLLARLQTYSSEDVTTEESWMPPLLDFLEKYGRKPLFVLVPNRLEAAMGLKPCLALESLDPDLFNVCELNAEVGWLDDCYHDLLHPNARGRRVLAFAIASMVSDLIQPQPPVGE